MREIDTDKIDTDREWQIASLKILIGNYIYDTKQKRKLEKDLMALEKKRDRK